MKDRILKIRKENNLTQDAFAEQLGLSKNFVWMLEKGERDPSDRTISDICKKFGISEEWLRNGIKPMHKETDSLFSELLSDLEDSDDDFIKSLIKVYMGLDKDSKDALRKIARGMAEEYKRRG